ncbi:MAG: histidine kinase dimerization/phospho-acceptor domain-containing protein, partial [Vicinamibacterales bacterium]
MTGSIRARLTTWYVGVLAVATLSLTGASWWLSGQSVVGAADISLEARVEGVRAFLENPRTRLTVEGLRDEFGEYAELTRGEAVLEVIDASGVVLVRPAIRGWADMDVQPVDESAGAPIQPVDRVLDGLPFRVAAARMDVAGRQFRVTVGAPMGPAYAALNRFHRLLLLALPLVLVFAGAGGYWISRRALAPVDRITREMQAITVERLDRRVEVPAGDDEVSRLASTVNVVLARLQAAVGDIVRFTADASHELRTPVSLVRTTAELALRREREPEAYRAALVDVLGHARRMSVLVEDLLVLARTDAGLEPGGGAIADLADIARSACDDASAVAAARAVALRVGPLAGPVRVRGEAALVRRLLTILVDNAVKYSPAGSVVDVEVG